MTKSEKSLLNDSDPNKKEEEKTSDSKKEESPEEKLKNIEEKLLRTMAEMENQRRRFERAITSFKNDEKLKDNKDLNKIIEGIDVVKKDLISIFKKNGIESIECVNKKFDPNFHQAMLEIENNTKDAGTVIQEIQKGYMMKNRLLRPSLVGVTKKTSEKAGKK